MDPVIEGRLKKGATKIGELWREGKRCSSGWGVKEVDFQEGEDTLKSMERWACQCAEKTDFCKGKSTWFRLAVTDCREVIEGEHGVPFMMTAEEWDLTKLTMKVEIPEVGIVEIGPKGPVTMTDMMKHMPAPDGLKSTLRVLKTFPGSRVQGVQEAPITVVETEVSEAVETEPVVAEPGGEKTA